MLFNRRFPSPVRLRRRRQSRDPLAGIKIPSPFDIVKFCEAVAEHRGRPLVVEAVEGVSEADGELCGLWIEFDHADYIAHEASTSPLHRDHIVLHEVSHMLLGHTGSTEGPGPDLATLFTGINPDTVRNVLGRANFSTPQEREAEQLATRIAAAVNLRAIGQRPPELDRLDTALRAE